MSDSNAQPSRHTPGPWTYHHEPSLNRYAVRAEPFGTETILSISYWSRTPIWDRERAEADASRIVSCVNACDGINPEAVPKLVNIARLFKDVMECRRDGPWRDVPAFRLRWSIPEDETVEAFCERVVATALANAKGGEA